MPFSSLDILDNLTFGTVFVGGDLDDFVLVDVALEDLFGQRVFHVEDPRARIIKATYEKLIATGYAKRDAFHDIALEIEERALADEYFASRQLFPNTNFYASLLLRAINIPPRMFPVITAIGNMPGWIAHWNEETHSPDQRIHRPRQVYMGRKRHAYTPREKRKS